MHCRLHCSHHSTTKQCLSHFKDRSGSQRHAKGRKMCLWQTSYLNTIKMHSTGSQPFMCHAQSRLGHTLGFQLSHMSRSFQSVHILELHARSMVRMGNPTFHRSLILQSVATLNVCARLLSQSRAKVVTVLATMVVAL